MPKFTGFSPVLWALISGEPEFGLTVHRMDDGLDTGDILVQHSLPIGPADTGTKLVMRGMDLIPGALAEALSALECGTAVWRPQNKAKRTYFHKRSQHDSLIVCDMAKNYADRLQAVYRAGPYKLLGWSFGGVVVHELAIELRRRGGVVQRLVLLDPARRVNGTVRNQVSDEGQIESYVLDRLRSIGIDIPEQSGPFTYRQAEELLRQQRELVEPVLPLRQLFDFVVQSHRANQLYLQEHMPDVFDGDMVIFSAARSENYYDSSHAQCWRPYVAGDITAYSVDCAHNEMMASLSMYCEQLKLSLNFSQ